MEFSHIPVLFRETIDGLAVHPNGIYVDGTVGGAGHSREIASRLSSQGLLIGLDRDPDAIAVATKRLQGLPAMVVASNYADIAHVLETRGIASVDGVLLDLGVSSHQLDVAERGFSYHADASLDMRMSQHGFSAKDLLATYNEEEIARILWCYGEEKFSRTIAKNIVKTRADTKIETTAQLAEIVQRSVPQKYRREKNPCKKTFQAIRIAVNDEFGYLQRGLESAFHVLKPGGRLCVISFHSLEDRIVKQQFAQWCKGCICPPEFPTCVCGKIPEGKLVNRKPITASEKELAENHRSRSAKLRIIERG